MIMNTCFDSKKFYLLILAGTSIVCSKVLFFLFNDPEGPNLLIVTVLATILYFLSLIIYSFLPLANPKRLSSVIFIQMLIITGFYFCLK